MIYVFYILSIFLILSVLIPFIRSDHWTVRVFDYPRFQKLILIFISVIVWLFIDDKTIYADVIFVVLGLCTIYLAWVIIPYTPLGKKMIDKTELKPNEKPLNFLVSNVYQENNSLIKAIANAM